MSASHFDPAAIWKQTRTGVAFRPLGEGVDDICIEDIAHALSQICRYTGHCCEHYSVAEHCVRVSYACDPADAFAGLMHDAAEAYIGDVSQPLKMAMRALADGQSHYDQLEARIERRVAEKFGLTLPWPASVKRADLVLLATEARDIMEPPPEPWNLPYPPLEKTIYPMDAAEASLMFVARFHELDAARVRRDLAEANACLASVRAQRKAWRDEVVGARSVVRAAGALADALDDERLPKTIRDGLGSLQEELCVFAHRWPKSNSDSDADEQSMSQAK